MNETLDINKFEPAVAELNALVLQTKDITATDLTDKSQLEVVKRNRIELKNARVRITKTGKELRDGANKFASAVIAKEKELIAIISPEEERLSDIEEQAKQLEIIEGRKKQLPYRTEKLNSINDSIEITEEELLTMDDAKFDGYYNQRMSNKNEVDRVALEKQQKEQEEERERIRIAEDERIEKERKAVQEEQDKKQRELDERERLMNEEKQRIESEQQAERDRIEREKQVEADRIQREKDIAQAEENARIETENKIKEENERKEREAKEAEDKRIAEKRAEGERIKKTKAYNDFLASHGWTKEESHNFKIEETATGYTLYKVLGAFEK